MAKMQKWASDEDLHAVAHERRCVGYILLRFSHQWLGLEPRRERPDVG